MHDRALERIKETNDGVLPSDLYLQTNEELRTLLFDLTGKFAPARTSKTILVTRIQKHTGASADASATKKRKLDTENTVQKQSKVSKRGCLPSLSAGQISEMRRILVNQNIEGNTQDQLRSIWYRMGVIRKFPRRDSKANIIKLMVEFATRNLEAHGL